VSEEILITLKFNPLYKRSRDFSNKRWS